MVIEHRTGGGLIAALNRELAEDRGREVNPADAQLAKGLIGFSPARRRRSSIRCRWLSAASSSVDCGHRATARSRFSPQRSIAIGRSALRGRWGVPMTRDRMAKISVQRVLEVVGDFDQTGGASLGLVAWELSVHEERVIDAWERAQADDLIKPAGNDPLHGEQMWRLTVGGWAARRDRRHDST